MSEKSNMQDIAGTPETNTSSQQTQERVSEKLRNKGASEIEKKINTLEKLEIKYIPTDSVSPNNYNPNRQTEQDFELLVNSIREDGFTQPVVAVDVEGKTIIIDGEHRWRAAKTLGIDEIPVCFVEMTLEQAKIATLRHNRARGSEDLELAAEVLRDLKNLGALDWATDSLGLDTEDVQGMIADMEEVEQIAMREAQEAQAAQEKAEQKKLEREQEAQKKKEETEARKAKQKEAERSVDAVESTDKSEIQISASSEGAATAIKERDEKLKAAKTAEERKKNKRRSENLSSQSCFSRRRIRGRAQCSRR